MLGLYEQNLPTQAKRRIFQYLVHAGGLNTHNAAPFFLVGFIGDALWLRQLSLQITSQELKVRSSYRITHPTNYCQLEKFALPLNLIAEKRKK
jgi:hypothetical protein